jgi:predicted ATPase
MSLIDELLQDARSGRSAVLVLVGEVGSGKSALLDYARTQATDMSLLRARGIQSEAQIPFAALFELLRPALGQIHSLSSPQRAALESALALRPAQAHDRFAVGAGTLALLAAYCEETPLLVLIDDAQWIDPSSAAALLFALRRFVADRITVILGARDGLPALHDGTDLRVQRLAGLERQSAQELLAQHADGRALTADVVDRLHRATNGNPLALIELAVAQILTPGYLGMLRFRSSRPLVVFILSDARPCRHQRASCSWCSQPATPMTSQC